MVAQGEHCVEIGFHSSADRPGLSGSGQGRRQPGCTPGAGPDPTGRRACGQCCRHHSGLDGWSGDAASRLPAGHAPPGPLRRRQAAVSRRWPEPGAVRATTAGRPQGPAAAEPQLLPARIPDSSQRRRAAAHLRCHALQCAQCRADLWRQWRAGRRGRRAVPHCAEWPGGDLEPRHALPRRPDQHGYQPGGGARQRQLQPAQARA